MPTDPAAPPEGERPTRVGWCPDCQSNVRMTVRGKLFRHWTAVLTNRGTVQIVCRGSASPARSPR